VRRRLVTAAAAWTECTSPPQSAKRAFGARTEQKGLQLRLGAFFARIREEWSGIREMQGKEERGSGHWIASELTVQKRKASSFGWGPFLCTQNHLAQRTCGNAARRPQKMGRDLRIFVVLHNHSGCTCGGNSRIIDGGLRTQRTQPTSGKPCARNHELRPATIQANPNVRRRRHRWMTQSAGTVAIEPDFCRDDGKSGRLALRADHLYTSGGPKIAGTPRKRIEGVIQHSE